MWYDFETKYPEDDNFWSCSKAALLFKIIYNCNLYCYVYESMTNFCLVVGTAPL